METADNSLIAEIDDVAVPVEDRDLVELRFDQDVTFSKLSSELLG